MASASSPAEADAGFGHRVGGRWRLVAALAVAWSLIGSTALAHRLDEYLQSVLVHVSPGRVAWTVQLSPGVEVAEQVLRRVDENADGEWAAAEWRRYGAAWCREVEWAMDGRRLEVRFVDLEASPVEELRSGHGVVRLEAEVDGLSLRPGSHVLSWENRHLTDLSVHLVNAAKPTTALVRIDRQIRNETQSAGRIEFTVGVDPAEEGGGRAVARGCGVIVVLAAGAAAILRASRRVP